MNWWEWLLLIILVPVGLVLNYWIRHGWKRCLLMVLLLAPCTAQAEEVQRYIVRDYPSRDITVKLDTETGKAWYLAVIHDRPTWVEIQTADLDSLQASATVLGGIGKRLEKAKDE